MEGSLRNLSFDLDSLHFSRSLNPPSSNKKIAKLPGGSETEAYSVPRCCCSLESLP